MRAPGHELTIRGQTRLLEPVAVTHLADVAVTDRPTVTRNLRLLEKEGLIRIDGGEDRRGCRNGVATSSPS